MNEVILISSHFPAKYHISLYTAEIRGLGGEGGGGEEKNKKETGEKCLPPAAGVGTSHSLLCLHLTVGATQGGATFFPLG